MPARSLRRFSLAPLSVVVAALAAGSGAAAAPAQYGPSPPPTTIGPVTFAVVVTTATQGPEGNTLAAQVGKTEVEVTVPPRAFSIPLQVTVIAPRAAELRPHLTRSGISGSIVFAVGVTGAKVDGTPIRGRLSAAPLRLTLEGPKLRPGVRVVHWDGNRRRFVAVPSSRITLENGRLTIRFNRGDQFVVLAPAR